jgi:methionine-rich copper-binding protein CopC
VRRFFSALVLALFAATAIAVPAQAHAELKSSNPASGATLDAPPKQVELTFSDVVSLPDGDAITITGPDGAKWPVSQAHAVDKTITAVVDGASAHAGAHTVAWRAQADDGDVISGTFTFTVALTATSSSTAAPTSSVTMSAPVTNAPPSTTPASSGGVPPWVLIVVVLVVLVGAVLLVRRRKA